jgi:hypothetical protein
MKRFFAIVVSSLMIISFLAACVPPGKQGAFSKRGSARPAQEEKTSDEGTK